MTLPSIFTDMLSLAKKNMETAFQSTSLMQEQTEYIAKWMLEQGSNLQAENRKFLEQWLENAKKQQKEYQEAYQAQLAKLEQFASKKP